MGYYLNNLLIIFANRLEIIVMISKLMIEYYSKRLNLIGKGIILEL